MQDVGKRVVQVNDCRVPSCIWQNGNKKNVWSILAHSLLNTFSEGNEKPSWTKSSTRLCRYVLYAVWRCVDVEICPKISFTRMSRRSLICNAGVAFIFMLNYSVHVNNAQWLSFFTTQKYSRAIELNYYNEEYYIKRAAAFTKLGNYKGEYCAAHISFRLVVKAAAALWLWKCLPLSAHIVHAHIFHWLAHSSPVSRTLPKTHLSSNNFHH